MRAFHIAVDGFDPMIACAETLAKARYFAFKSAHEAGYTTVTFPRITGRRAPDLDAWAQQQKEPRLVAEYYARELGVPV